MDKNSWTASLDDEIPISEWSFLYSVYYSSWCEETAPSTLSAWVYAPKTNWMEVIGRPFLGLDWHIFLVVKPHTETLDLNSCRCLGQGHFVPCQQVASSLRRCDWPWHSRLLSFLPQQLSHPPRRLLCDLMEHISSLLTPLCPCCTSDLLHTLLTCMLLKDIWSALAALRMNRK